MRQIFTCLFLLIGLLSFSQNEKINRLEDKLFNQSGLKFVKTAVELSEEYYAVGNYEKAVEKGKSAYVKAAKMSDKEWMAIALNRQAKALIQLPKQKRANRAEAIANLNQSIRMTQNNNLKMNNLEQLRQIAVLWNKKKDIEEIDERIAEMKGTGASNTAELAEEKPESGSGLFGRRNAVKKAFEENEELNEQVASLEAEKARLRRERSNLKYLLRGKEEEIQDMTEEQMKQELIFVEQERILDSIVYQTHFDSLIIVQKEMALQNQKSILAEQQAEIALQNSQRNFLLALAAIILIIAFGLYNRFTNIKAHNLVLEEKNIIIREEKQRSEELLLNILPAAIADELKERGAAKTKYYNRATVLFADFKNFSKIAKELSPEELVSELDYCFKKFDAIVGKYGLEKIKTIGDAYMCAGGVPKPKNGHVIDTVNAAMEMQEFLMSHKLNKVEKGEPFFEARLGVHTGPVIAGVVGLKKFAYDIWGDTVNVASRMESSGESGKVNISESTYQLVKDKFECEYRGKVPAKNVGEIDMYFVEKKVA